MSLLPLDEVTTLPQLWDNAYRRSVPEQVVLTVHNEQYTLPGSFNQKISAPQQLTYKEINARAHCLGAYLVSRGLERGDRVVILSDNLPVYFCFDLAVQFAGGVNVTLSRRFGAGQVAEVMRATKPRFLLIAQYETYRQYRELLNSFAHQVEIVSHHDMADELEEADRATTLDSAITIGKVFWRENAQRIKIIKEEVQPHHPAAIFYDARTLRHTNVSGVMLSHDNLITALKTCAGYAVGLNRASRVLSFLSPSSAYARVAGYYLPIGLGLPVHYLNRVPEVATALQQLKPDVLIAQPTYLRYLFAETRRGFQARYFARAGYFDRAVRDALRERKLILAGQKPGLWLRFTRSLFGGMVFPPAGRLHLSSVKLLFAGAGNLDTDLEYLYELLGHPVITGFGLNETSGFITLNPHMARVAGSAGSVIAGGRIKIQRGALEHEVQAGTAVTTPLGIIYVGGRTLMLGTWQVNGNGTGHLVPTKPWYDTGLTGYFENGYLFLRKKETV